MLNIFKKLVFLLPVITLLSLSGCFILDAVKDRYKPFEFMGVDGNNVLVRFIFDAPSATEVWLAGTFNNWTADKSKPKYPNAEISQGALIPMKKDEKGYWNVTIPLPAGRYQYKYVVDQLVWREDPNSPEFVDDGFGGKNSIIIVISK